MTFLNLICPPNFIKISGRFLKDFSKSELPNSFTFKYSIFFFKLISSIKTSLEFFNLGYMRT